MRKNFLLLFLLAVLPLAGWAASADLVTKPTLRGGLVYNDAAQALMEGTATFPTNYSTTQGGVRYFATPTSGTPTYNASTWSADFPTRLDAGTYYVWYIVLADNVNYSDNSPVQSLGSVIIARRPITTDDFTFVGRDLTYNGGAWYLVETATWKNVDRGDFQYKLSTSTTWSYDRPYDTNAGNYTVQLAITPDNNHLVNGSTLRTQITSVDVEFKKATPVITAPTARDLTFTNSWQQLIDAGSSTFGTLNYQAPTGRYTGNQTNAANIQGGYVGDYTVNYFVNEDANWKSASSSITVTIKQAIPTFNASSGALATGLVYKGNSVAQQLVTTAYTCTTGGSVRYHIAKDGGAIGSAINGITNVTATQPGTYDIYYSIVAANNNYQATPVSETTKIGTVVIAKAELAASAKSAEKVYDGTAFNDPSAFYSVGESPKFLNGEDADAQAAILAKLFTVTGYEQTNAGTYNVTVTSKDDNSVPYTISPMIEKITKLEIKKNETNDWTTAPAIAGSWPYGTSAPQGLAGAAEFAASGEPTFKYYDNSQTEMTVTDWATLSANADGETYYMKAFVEETANYNGLESGYIPFRIIPADPDWAATDQPAMTGWEYLGEVTVPTGTVAGYTTTYSYKYFDASKNEIPEDEVTNTLPVGSYYAKIIAAATSDYTAKESDYLGFTISPTTLPATLIDDYEVIYNAQDQNPGRPAIGDAIKAATGLERTVDFTLSFKPSAEFKNVGEYTIVVTGKGNYAKVDPATSKVNTKEITFTINPATVTAEDFVAAKANNLTYTNENQELIKPAAIADGSIVEGTFLYKLSTDDDSKWSTSVPTGFNAGDYTVQTKFEATANFNPYTAIAETEVKILPVSLTIMMGNVEKTWTGVECTDEEVEEAYSFFVGSLQGDDFYNPPFKLSLPVTEENNFIDAGSHPFKKLNVEWNKDKEGNEVVHNYKINWTGNGEVLINKAEIAAGDFIEPVAATLTYNTQAQNLVKDGYDVTATYLWAGDEEATPIGTIKFATAKDGTYSEAVPQATNVSEFNAEGKKSVWYMVEGDANHKDFGPVELTATMAARSWTPVLAFENVPNDDQDGVYGQDYMPANLSVKDQLDAETQTLLVEGTDYTLAITKDGEAYTGEKLEDVGTYVFTYTAQGNYEGSVDRTIQILPATFEAPEFAAVDYNAQPQEPNYAIAGLTEGTDYTVEVVADDATWTNAGEYVINYTGIGNYTGSQHATYVINKLEAIAKAADATKVYDGVVGLGDTEVAITYDGLLTGEPEDAIVAGLGAIKAVNDKGEESANVGTYTIVLDPEKFVSTNYTVLAANKAATFTITAPSIAVVWNDEYEIPEGEFTKVYGGEEPELPVSADNVMIVTADEYEIPAADVDAIIAATVLTRAEGENVGTYDVNMSGDEDAAVLNNYDVTFGVGEDVFTITPATLKISLDAQSKVYDGNPAEVTITADDLSVAGLIGDDTVDVIDVSKLTAVFADDEVIMAGDYQFTLALADEEVPAAQNYTLSPLPSIYTIKVKVTIDDLTMKVGEDVEAFIAAIDPAPFKVEGIAEADKAKFSLDVAEDYVDFDGKIDAELGAYADGLVIVATGDAATKYKGWDEVTGKLIVVPADPIILADNDTYTNDVLKEGVTVSFSDRNVNQDKWNVMVLPFDVTPGQISDAFGYAIVDRLNEANAIDNEVHFKVVTSGIIPAGEPFIFKPTSEEADGAKANFNEVFFYNVNIEETDGENTNVEDAAGNKFWGTFQKETTFYGQQYWYMSKGVWKDAKNYTSSKPVSLKPFRAYAEIVNPAGARIIIEEGDGTLTAIDAVEFNNMINGEGWYTIDGKKLNDAPTRKGVYINNGQKVVIK